MASAYPGALDSFATNKVNATATTTDHPNHHNDLADAVNKIEAELGVNPSGAAATVVARLDALGLTSTSTPTLVTSDLNSMTAGEIEVALNITTGGAVLYGGSVIAGVGGVRITIDSVVVIDEFTVPTQFARGESVGADDVGVLMLPPMRATTSLKIEIKNMSAITRVLGWHFWYDQ